MQLLGALVVLSRLPRAQTRAGHPSRAQPKPSRAAPRGGCAVLSCSPCPPAPAIPAGSGSSPALPSVSQQDVGNVGAHFWPMVFPEAQRRFGNYSCPRDGKLGSSQSHPQRCWHAHCEQLRKRRGEQEGKASLCPSVPRALGCACTCRELCSGPGAPMWPSLCLAPARGQQHPHTLVQHWAPWQDTKRCQDTRKGTRGVARTRLAGKGSVAVRAPGWDTWGQWESCQHQGLQKNEVPQSLSPNRTISLIATCHRDMQGQAMLAGALAVAFALPELGQWHGTPVHNPLGAAMAPCCCHRSYRSESAPCPCPLGSPETSQPSSGGGWRKGMFLGSPISGLQQAPVSPDIHVPVYFQ